MEKSRFHPESVEIFHPKDVNWRHWGHTANMKVHQSQRFIKQGVDCWGKKPKLHECCRREVGMEGCTEIRGYECCKREIGEKGCSRLYGCCLQEENASGCQQRMR